MDLTTILKQLYRERELVEEAIAVLERLLAESARPRRGRPPAWLEAARAGRGRPRKKPPATAGAALRLDAVDRSHG